MNYLGGLILGSIAGLIGAAIWGAIAYYGHMEIGWIAWGIGAAVGVAVSAGSKGGGLVPSVIAILITIASICGGKLLAVQMAMSELDQVDTSEFDNASDENIMLWMANRRVRKMMNQNEPLRWRNGSSWMQAEELSDYPVEVEKAVREEFQAASPDEIEQYKEEIRAEVQAAIGEFKSKLRKTAFVESFGLFDIIFFLLGIVTAGKIAYSDYVEA